MNLTDLTVHELSEKLEKAAIKSEDMVREFYCSI